VIPSAAPTTRPRLDLRANASAALAAVLLGASVVAARVAVREVPPLSLAVLRFGQAFLLLAAVVFLGVPGGAVAFLLWTMALSRLTPTRVAVYVNLNPLVAALLGVLLLAERRSGLFVLGFAAVLGGVLLVNWPAPHAGRDA
jgi:drug/metabolite transporter (DMT)-like permease